MLRIYTYLQQDVRSHCPTFTSSCYQLKLFSFGCVFRAKLRGVQPLAIAIKTRRGWWLIAVSYKLHLSKHKSRSTTAIGSKVHLNYRYSFFCVPTCFQFTGGVLYHLLRWALIVNARFTARSCHVKYQVRNGWNRIASHSDICPPTHQRVLHLSKRDEKLTLTGFTFPSPTARRIRCKCQAGWNREMSAAATRWKSNRVALRILQRLRLGSL